MQTQLCMLVKTSDAGLVGHACDEIEYLSNSSSSEYRCASTEFILF